MSESPAPVVEAAPAEQPTALKVRGRRYTEPRPPSPRARANALYDALLDVLGDAELVQKVLRRFSGTQMPWPPVADAEHVITERAIHRRLLRQPDTAQVRGLAQHHGMSMRQAAKAFAQREGVGLLKFRERRSM